MAVEAYWVKNVEDCDMKKFVWCSCIGCLAIVAVSGMYSMEWIRSVGNYISGGTVAVYNT